MTKQQAKEYIIKNFNTSSGKRITDMLNRYWKMNEDDSELISAVEDIFGVKVIDKREPLL